MDYDAYVKQNQVVVQFVKDVMPGTIDKYVGTLDYASARFNTILIKLSQDPLLADQHKKDVEECFNAQKPYFHLWSIIVDPLSEFMIVLNSSINTIIYGYFMTIIYYDN